MRAVWGAGIAAALVLGGIAVSMRGSKAPAPTTAVTGAGGPTSAPVAAVDRAPPSTHRSTTEPPAASSRAADAASRAARAEEESAPSEVLASVRSAIASDGPQANATLMRALDSDDGPAKIEAIDELVRRGHRPLLGRLMKLDPADDPFVGPTALLAIGALARDADPAARDGAVRRLEQLIAQEKERRAADSAGNLLVIFEALGAIRSEASARLLEQELNDAHHGAAARVAIVDAVEACGRRSSVPALVTYGARFAVQAEDPFERELERELEAALARATATLSAKGT